MLLHGGRYENYCYRGHVTHIICTNLPDTKLKQMAHERWVSCKHSCALESLPGWCKPDLWPPSELRCSVTVALMLCSGILFPQCGLSGSWSHWQLDACCR